MDSFVIHSVPGSPFGRTVLAVLIEKGAPFQFKRLTAGTLKSPEHLARHPFGKLPSCAHGAVQIYETQAIVRYIDRVIPAPALTPLDPARAARMDQAMGIVDCYLFPKVSAPIGFQRVVGPILLGTTPDLAVIEAAMPDGHVAFGALAGLLGGDPYLAGDAVSLADFLVFPHFDFLARTPELAALTADHTGLADWVARMARLPSIEATTTAAVAAMG